VRDRFTRRRSKPNGLVLLHGRVTGNAVAERHSNYVDTANSRWSTSAAINWTCQLL